MTCNVAIKEDEHGKMKGKRITQVPSVLASPKLKNKVKQLQHSLVPSLSVLAARGFLQSLDLPFSDTQAVAISRFDVLSSSPNLDFSRIIFDDSTRRLVSVF